MVEKFGMFHFLKTLIANEMTSLKWHEFNDMKYIMKQIHPNMSWKDCPIECATLFHSCVNMFVYKHILNNNGTLSKVKEYVILYEYNIMDLLMLTLYCGLKRKFLNK